MLLGEEDQVKIVKKLPKALKAPVEKNAKVGEVEYYLNGVKIGAYPILAKEGVKRFSFSWCVEKVEKAFFMQRAR